MGRRTSAAVEKLVVLGVEDPFTIELLETLLRRGTEVLAGVLTAPPRWEVSPLPTVLQDDEISDLLLTYPAVVSGFAPRNRRRVRKFAVASGFSYFPSIVDPTAVVASTARIADGSYVNALAVVAGHTHVGTHAVLNKGANLGHHSHVEDFASLGQGALVASNCRICAGATLGAGAILRENTIVGPGSVVGAGAVVLKNVEANAIVVGNPARIIGEAPDWKDLATEVSVEEWQ